MRRSGNESSGYSPREPWPIFGGKPEHTSLRSLNSHLAWTLLLNALISLTIVALIALRKPSTATAALVLYA